MKAQWVRVADVVLIGPLMFAGGVALAARYPTWGIVLSALGVGTVLYNGSNYLEVEKRR